MIRRPQRAALYPTARASVTDYVPMTTRRLLGATLAVLALAGCTAAPPVDDPDDPTTTTSTRTTTSTPPAAVGTISDGHWIVGPVPEPMQGGTTQARQISAGRYQATADVSPGCYWWISDVTVGPASAQPGTADEGRPVVELRSGDHWQVWHCGSWSRVD